MKGSLLRLFKTRRFGVIALIFGLLAGGVAAYVIWNQSNDGDGTVSHPQLVTDSTDNNGNTAVVRPASEAVGDVSGQSGRFIFRLSKGQAEPDHFEPLAPTAGTPLDQDDIQAVLDRLPPLTEAEDDQQAFRLPEELLPPPQPGETVTDPFPLPPEAVAPEVSSGPLEVLRFAPEGEIPLAPFLSVTFNQPMVPLATVEALAAADVPVTLTPALPGIWRWVGTQTLTFEYQGDEFDRFPMATEYVAEVPAGIVSANGNALAEAVTWQFSTPPPQLVSSYPNSGPQPLDPIFFARFDQQIDPEAVLASIEVTADGRSVDVQLATEAEIAADIQASSLTENAEPGRWLAFRAAQSLPTAADVRVVIGPGTPSAEGPLQTSTAQAFEFFTYDALRVDSHRCAWSEVECPPFTPFFIEFNNPIDMELFTATLVEIEPALPGATVQVFGNHLEIHGPTQGRTTYRVTLNSDIQDIFGQTLGDDETLRFQVGSAPSLLSGPDTPFVTLDPSADQPVFSVYTINYDTLDVHVYAVDPSDWPDFHTYRENYYREGSSVQPPGQEVLNETIEITAEADVFTEVPIDLSQALSGDTGHLIVVVEPPPSSDRQRDRNILQTWVQVTQIGLDAFSDSEQLVVWTTDLRDGTPLADVTVTLIENGGEVTTDQDGLAQLSLSNRSGGALIARQGEDAALLPASPYYWDNQRWQSWSWPDGLRWYVFDDRQMYRPGEEVHVKGWLRLVADDSGSGVSLPLDQIDSVQYQLLDPQWNELADGQVDLNESGGFDLTFTIPENSNLGFANLTFTVNGTSRDLAEQEYWHSFQIQEFRRPEFEVTARNETTGPYFISEHGVVAVEAAYFAGGPLPNADVTWFVCSQPGSYSPPGWSGFVFGTWTPWWWDGPVYYDDFYYEEEIYYDDFYPPTGRGSSCDEFSEQTDAAGSHYLRIDFDTIEEPQPQPYTLSAEATVFDVNRQAWSASTSLLVHPADLYVGLRSEKAFVQRGEELEIEIIVTDLEGEAVSGRSVMVTAAQLDWIYRDGSWVEEAVDSQTCEVLSEAEPVTCTFTTEMGGTYQITAVVEDEQGRKNQSQFERWVSGGNQRPVRNVQQEAVTLIPDKETYAPGDVAQILVQAPFSPAEGLLTMSLSNILSTESFQVGEEGHILSIPITEEHIPNLNIKVDLVGAAARTDDAGNLMPDLPPRPAFATGRLTLDVSTASRSLSVQVTPAQARLQPGSDTAVDVQITDDNGQPVAGAEMAVVVVDEAILALTNYQLADPLAIFYQARGGQVRSQYTRPSIVLANPQTLADAAQQADRDQVETVSAVADTAMEESEEMAEDESGLAFNAAATAPAMAPQGADGRGTLDQAGQPIQVRTDFNPLAAFVPTVRSDSSGQARVELKLPDNLTRYRVMVVAVAGENKFGTGESNMTARLPLMVRPAAPRFLNFGDQFELPVVLQNQTDEEMTVDVVVQSGNIELIESSDAGQTAGQQVVVPANDRVEVRFPATTMNAGVARFQLAAVSGTFADAATVELPVYTPATTEAFATYGVVDEGGVAQPVAAPEGVFTQFGGLEIQTSSTALQALTDAVLYLVDYPYECSEQVASRILAIAALRDVLTAFEAEGLPDSAVLEAAVQRDIERLEGLQNGDGGWPVWERGKESVPFYSIHAAYALHQAGVKNFTVSSGIQQQALGYLENIEAYYPHWYSQSTRWSLSAYALYVRHEMGDSDPQKAARLLDEAGLEELSLEALGWLWPVLDSSGSHASQVEAIGGHFNNRVVETAAAANFTTSYGDQAYLMLHSARRTDGVILNSMIAVQPESDLIPKVVNGLLANRVRGRWGNTQENVFILLAMDRYFNTFEAQTPDFVARIWLGETYAGEHVYEGRSTERHETVVPMSYLVDGEELSSLIIDKSGTGRLYYRLGLSYAPQDLNLEPLDMGFTVQRTYEGVDDPEDVYQDEDGRWHIRAGARVRVQLTMVTSNRRYNVALVDPLPAGLEIINPALAVSGDIPQDPTDNDYRYGWWWWGTWYEHQNMRDERAEAFTTLLWDGVYNYSYVARATTPGTFIVPPAKAEEMYAPEVFGRSSSDWVIVE